LSSRGAADGPEEANRMKYIALVAVLGILLLQFTGAVPSSGAGESIAITLALLAAGAAVGIHEAWTQNRGVLGWIVSIVVALVGAFLIANLAGVVAGLLLIYVLFDVALAIGGGPLIYVTLAGLMIAALLGSWGALWLVNRFR
jgi:hypothetical protein